MSTGARIRGLSVAALSSIVCSNIRLEDRVKFFKKNLVSLDIAENFRSTQWQEKNWTGVASTKCTLDVLAIGESVDDKSGMG